MAITINAGNALGAKCLGVVRTKAGILEVAGSALLNTAAYAGTLGTPKTVGGLNGVEMTGNTADYIDLPGIAGTTDIIPLDQQGFCVVTIGSADTVAGADVRFVSKDVGTAEGNHDWMVGDSGPSNNPRSRIRAAYGVDGTTTVPLSTISVPTATVFAFAGGLVDEGASARHRTSFYDGTTYTQDDFPASSTNAGEGYRPQAGATAKIGRTSAIAANPWDGMHYATFWFSDYLSQAELESLYANPDQVVTESAAGPSITNLDGDNTVFEGQTSVQINGTSFGATQGTGSVTVSPTDNIADVAAVTPTVSAWGDTQITLSALNFPAGVAEGGTAYVFVTDGGGSSNASGHAITRLDITAPLLSSGTATGVTANAATPQVTTNDATGQAWHVIVPSAEGTPSGTQIKAGQNAAGGAPVASGTVNPVSGTTVTFTEVTGLTSSTSYKICFYQEDAATPTPNGSNVTTHTFSTLAAPTVSFAVGDECERNNRTVLANQTNVIVALYNDVDDSLVLRLTSHTTDGTGLLAPISDGALAGVTTVNVMAKFTGGEKGAFFGVTVT